jgi:hypothetical protein
VLRVFRVLGLAALAGGVVVGAPFIGIAADLPANLQQAINAPACDNTDALTAAITSAVSAAPGLGADVASAATARCPADAALIAGAAANADPNHAQDIIAAVIAALPPDQQDVQTAALGPLGGFQGPGSPDFQGPSGAQGVGAPLIAPFTVGTSPR